VALRVEVDQTHPPSAPRQTGRQVHAGGGFPHAPLLVHDGNAAHGNPFPQKWLGEFMAKKYTAPCGTPKERFSSKKERPVWRMAGTGPKGSPGHRDELASYPLLPDLHGDGL